MNRFLNQLSVLFGGNVPPSRDKPGQRVSWFPRWPVVACPRPRLLHPLKVVRRLISLPSTLFLTSRTFRQIVAGVVLVLNIRPVHFSDLGWQHLKQRPNIASATSSARPPLALPHFLQRGTGCRTSGDSGRGSGGFMGASSSGSCDRPRGTVRFRVHRHGTCWPECAPLSPA